MAGNDQHESRGPHFDSEWCRVLRSRQRALSEREGLTNAKLASAVGVSQRTLARIMAGIRPPDPTEIIALCRALDLPILRMLASIDVVPGITNLLDYASQLEEMASRTELNATLVGVDQVHGATVIANKVVATGRYRASIQPLWQGTGWSRRHYSDPVAFEPLDVREGAKGFRDGLESLISPELAWFTAGFIGFPPTAQGLATPDLTAVVNVPRFLAIRRGSGAGASLRSRVPELDPTSGLPFRMAHSICVLGSHWSGSADVASFLAHALDYDFTHVGFTAARAYSRLTHDWKHDLFDHDRFEVARTFFYGAELGRKRIWAAGGDGDIGATASLIGDPRNSVPIIVNLQVTDRLAEWAARTRVTFGHTDHSYEEDLQTIKDERRLVERVVRGLPQRAITLHVDLPQSVDIDFSDPEEDGRDAFFDYWALLSVDALEKLQTELSLPFDLEAAKRSLMAGGQ